MSKKISKRFRYEVDLRDKASISKLLKEYRSESNDSSGTIYVSVSDKGDKFTLMCGFDNLEDMIIFSDIMSKFFSESKQQS